MSESRLLTLNEAADQTGLTVDALRKRIKRGRIQAIRSNDGLVRVRLDDHAIDALKSAASTSSPPSRPASRLAEESLLVRELKADKAALREHLDRAEARVAELVTELQKMGEGRAAAEATAQARLEEIERLSGLLNAGLLTRLRDFFLAMAREGGVRLRLPGGQKPTNADPR